MSLQEEVTQSLRNQVKTAGEWLSKVSADTPQAFIALCLNYIQQLLTTIQEVSKLDFSSLGEAKAITPLVSPTLLEKAAPMPSTRRGMGQSTPKGPMTDYCKQAIGVMLALDGGALPINLAEVGVKTWEEEYKQNPSPEIRQKLYNRTRGAFFQGLARVREVLTTGNVPEADKDLFDRIIHRYPGMSAAQLDEIIAHYSQGLRSRPSRQEDPPANNPGGAGASVPKPQTEWMQPIWAILFHPEGQSLDKAELMRRTSLSDAFLEPVMFGALKSLDSIMTGNMDSPEPAFTNAVSANWPNKDLLEILSSISTGAEGELSLVSLHREINNAPQDESPRAKTEEASLQS